MSELEKDSIWHAREVEERRLAIIKEVKDRTKEIEQDLKFVEKIVSECDSEAPVQAYGLGYRIAVVAEAVLGNEVRLDGDDKEELLSKLNDLNRTFDRLFGNYTSRCKCQLKK